MKTDKQRKSVKCYSFIGVLLIVIIVAAVLVGFGVVTLPSSCENESDGMAMVSVRNAGGPVGSDEIDFSTSENSYYYLDIPTKGLKTHAPKTVGQYNFVKEKGGSTFSRTSCTVTVLVRFNNAKHNDKSIVVIGTVQMSVPSVFWASDEFVFEDNISVNIRESYYDELKGQENKLSSMKFTLYSDGNALPLSVESHFGGFGSKDFDVSGVSVTSTATLRPGDDGFGDNSGIDATPDIVVSNWFNSLPKWLQYGVYIFVGLAALAFLATLLRIIFGKK